MGDAVLSKCPCLAALYAWLCRGSRVAQDVPETMETVGRKTIAEEEPRYQCKPRSPADGAFYTALWSFEARAEEEMSFTDGDLFRVTDRSGEWWTAHKVDRNGRILDTGIVPYNYLARGETLEAQPWYFGKMNRFEAMKHLMDPQSNDGAFLVRLSEKDDIGYVISVKTEDKVKHYKIHQKDGKLFVDNTMSFTSLVDLVNHYQSNPMASVNRLKTSCVRKEPKPQDLCHCTVDSWELPKEEFTLEEQLGSGYFADVYRGRWKNRINVAIKLLKSEDGLSQKEFQLETHILKKLRHRHLIALFAICSTSRPFYIITELMEKGNLLNFLRGSEGKELDIHSLTDMACQVADGMEYLESQNSIHRDLAARNVLVGENYICKVADFGLARIIKEPFYICKDKKIPYKWSAPEALSHGCFSNKSDMWSFGVLLFEMFTYGGIPYPGFSNSETYQSIMEGYRMPAPPNCPKYLYTLMLSCWKEAPQDRPTFRAIKSQLEKECI